MAMMPPGVANRLSRIRPIGYKLLDACRERTGTPLHLRNIRMLVSIKGQANEVQMTTLIELLGKVCVS